MFILDSNEMKLATFAKGLKSTLTWKCGTKELVTSMSKSSKECSGKESSSDSQLLQKRRLLECMKLVNLATNIDNRSQKRGR